MFNDRIKLVADILKGTVLLLLGLGVFRTALDPGAETGHVQTVLVLSAASLLFGLVWLVLGLQRPKE